METKHCTYIITRGARIGQQCDVHIKTRKLKQDQSSITGEHVLCNRHLKNKTKSSNLVSCDFIITSGPRIGQACGIKIMAENNTKCAIHFKCQHGKKTSDCPQCKGSNTCVHHKYIRRCPICKANKLTTRKMSEAYYSSKNFI